jgi:hypothetical protein
MRMSVIKEAHLLKEFASTVTQKKWEHLKLKVVYNLGEM